MLHSNYYQMLNWLRIDPNCQWTEMDRVDNLRMHGSLFLDDGRNGYVVVLPVQSCSVSDRLRGFVA